MASIRVPHFGHTRHGLPVHQHAVDNLPAGNPVARFNAWLAVKITKTVGSMWCAYVFAGIALYGLPGALRPGGEGAVSWVAQTFLQLVLLSIIIVGQDVQMRASDARAAKTFEDGEIALDRLDPATAGGVTEILDAVKALGARLDGAASGERVVPPPAAKRPRAADEAPDLIRRVLDSPVSSDAAPRKVPK